MNATLDTSLIDPSLGLPTHAVALLERGLLQVDQEWIDQDSQRTCEVAPLLQHILFRARMDLRRNGSFLPDIVLFGDPFLATAFANSENRKDPPGKPSSEEFNTKREIECIVESIVSLLEKLGANSMQDIFSKLPVDERGSMASKMSEEQKRHLSSLIKEIQILVVKIANQPFNWINSEPETNLSSQLKKLTASDECAEESRKMQKLSQFEDLNGYDDASIDFFKSAPDGVRAAMLGIIPDTYHWCQLLLGLSVLLIRDWICHDLSNSST